MSQYHVYLLYNSGIYLLPGIEHKGNNMKKIKYIETDQQDLELVRPLWQKLLEHHKARSRHFTGLFNILTFEKRKKELLEKSAKGSMHIDLAKDVDTGELIGYCISTIYGDKQGEIDSIYVEASHRRTGIGDTLMKDALRWMESMAVKKMVIAVAAGNEEVFPFYSQYGFYPMVSILRQADNREEGR